MKTPLRANSVFLELSLITDEICTSAEVTSISVSSLLAEVFCFTEVACVIADVVATGIFSLPLLTF